jgi:AraC-like DNA-binding protein
MWFIAQSRHFRLSDPLAARSGDPVYHVGSSAFDRSLIPGFQVSGNHIPLEVLMQTTVSDIAVFAPPYQHLAPSDCLLDYHLGRGHALVWHLHDAERQGTQCEWLRQRPAHVPLFIVLPPANAIDPILSLIPQLNELRARGVLPNGPLLSIEPVRTLLRNAPRDLPSAMVAYFTRRGLLNDAKTRSLVLKIFELAPTVPSISGLARRLYTSRRTLGRFFEARGLPVPSHWLQFARLLFVATKLQASEDVPVFRVATQFGYPDGFTMSNQMKRLVGCRPSDVRVNLGYEWFVEEWLDRERNRSAMD